MSLLAETLLREEHENVVIPRWFREYVAATCSHKGHTDFCHRSHLAAALASSPYDSVDDMQQAVAHTLKYQKLLHVAVVSYSRPGTLTTEEIQAAEQAGASNEEIHLCILIACAFKMYNAYVKTIGNPGAEDSYEGIGFQLAQHGYM